jgi:hypothetical protein
MAEWLKARASKACIPLRVSGVRIPLSPPVLLFCLTYLAMILVGILKARLVNEQVRQSHQAG